jgi:TPR repeat protein
MDRYRRAADKGHSGAQFYLGALYEAGKGGVVQDFKQSVLWYLSTLHTFYPSIALHFLLSM